MLLRVIFRMLVSTRKNTKSVKLHVSHTRIQVNQPGTSADLKENITNGLSTSQEEDSTHTETGKKKFKRPLADIIRENQLLYNDYIKNKVLRLLRQLVVEKSSGTRLINDRKILEILSYDFDLRLPYARS
jgi:hypothetical protein